METTPLVITRSKIVPLADPDLEAIIDAIGPEVMEALRRRVDAITGILTEAYLTPLPAWRPEPIPYTSATDGLRDHCGAWRIIDPDWSKVPRA